MDRKKILKNTNNINKCFKELRNLYKTIPETKGCIDNLDICKGWCCKFQSPSMLYIEFLHIWQSVLRDYEIEEIINLIELCIRTYVSNDITKGCVLWDKETKLCKRHGDLRPFNCFIYGITPDEEFNPRYEYLKEKYKDEITAVIKPQCKLVSIVNGKKITKQDTDGWWNKLVDIEKQLGINKQDIHDGYDGTYRMFHDHLILHICPDNVIENLSRLRLSGELEEKEEVICTIINGLKNNSKTIIEKLKK